MTLLKPLLLYEDLLSRRVFLVTNFLRESEVEQVSGMKNRKKKKEINRALSSLRREVQGRKGVWEIADKNSFYHKKTNTVILFDIYHFSP